jgi:LysR family hydrogen peroxide-inducible transcriptional activator
VFLTNAISRQPGRWRSVRPDFRELEVFLKVVETRGFAAAARQLGCSQPAVSQTIAKLEEIFGGDLFERRRGAPLILTPIGKAILPSACILLHTVDDQILRAAATAQSKIGTLRVGFCIGVTKGAFRDAIARFMSESPDVRLELVEGLPDDLNRQLNERSLDMIFVALMPDIADVRLHREPLWCENLVVALPVDHEFASRVSLAWNDIASETILLRRSGREIFGYRSLIERFGNIRLIHEEHEVSRTTMLEMVSLGIGVTVTFESAVIVRNDIVFVPVQGPGDTARVDAIWHRADQNPLRHKLIGHVRRLYSERPNTYGARCANV